MSAFLNALPGAVAQGIIWGIMAIGVYITFRFLDFADLTVDSSMATGGAVFVVLVRSNHNLYQSLFMAFLAGCVAGLVTGLFHTGFGIPAILSGILTQLALYSINLRIMDGKSNLPISSKNYDLMVSLGNVPKSLIVGGVFALVLIIILYWFFGTQIGSAVRATGNNPNMARANGINTNVNKVFGLMLSNGIVAVSGALLAQYQGFADINMGRGAIVIGLAAVIIGEVLFGRFFRGIAFTLISVVFGGIIYYVVLTFVIQLGLNANDLKLFSAIVVAFFLGVPYWRGQLKTSAGTRETATRKKVKVGGAEDA